MATLQSTAPPEADEAPRPVVRRKRTVAQRFRNDWPLLLLAFPVVDSDRRLVGLVDVDLYTGERAELERRQESDDLFQLVGVYLTEAEQRRTGLAFRRRFPWLMCNVVGGMLAALLADAYEDVATLALVTPFIALVTGLAEGVTIQSVSLALQTMHGRRPTWAALARKVGREVLVGLLLGAACGLVVGLAALAWKGSPRAGLSLGLGIAGGVAASAAVGLALPFLLRLARRDPQVASGPVAGDWPPITIARLPGSGTSWWK